MKRTKPKSRRAPFLIALLLALAAAALIGVMTLNASLLHVMKATVTLPDLPPSFEGAKLLYITDIDLCGLNTPARAADAVMKLQNLRPDLLVLGGDFTSPTLMEVLNKSADTQSMLGRRSAFFQAISDFQAPMGRFVLIGREDAALSDPSAALRAGGFTPINGTRSQISIGDDALWLVGVDENTEGLSSVGASFRSGQCVLCVAESPDCFPRIVTAEAADSGPWADLCLAGKTHGGQINLFGRSILTLTELEQQFLHGWTRETGTPMLTSSGLGCETANLRLNSQAEVWLLTLTANP